MIKEILKLMSNGTGTLSGIARELGISREELKSRLEMMERMGYLEEFHGDRGDGCGSAARSACAFCSIGKVCSDTGENDMSKTRRYMLTEKGKRIAFPAPIQ